MQKGKLHSQPYNGTNNRKKTLARMKSDSQIQSIPVFDPPKEQYKNGEFVPRKFLGWKHVRHFAQTK